MTEDISLRTQIFGSYGIPYLAVPLCALYLYREIFRSSARVRLIQSGSSRIKIQLERTSKLTTTISNVYEELEEA